MLTIKSIESKSAKLMSNTLIDQDIIPQHGYSCAFVGSTGSGKSVLIANMLMRFYSDIYKPQDIYLFSPNAKIDDIANKMKLKPNNRVDKDMLKQLKTLLQNRKKECEEGPCNPMLIILDDFTGNKKMNNSNEIIQLFTASRHLNTSLWVSIHKYKALNRTCRLNCMSFFIFACNSSEIKAIYEEQGPPHQTIMQFTNMFKYCTDDRYGFMSILCKQPYKTRYRKNLETMLTLT